MRYVRSPPSGLKDSTVFPAFFIAPAMNPRTVCRCQPIFSMISKKRGAVLPLEHGDYLRRLTAFSRFGGFLRFRGLFGLGRFLGGGLLGCLGLGGRALGPC